MTATKENAVNQSTGNPWYIEVDKNGKIVSIFEHQPDIETIHHTHFKDKLTFLTTLGYTYKEHGIPSLESILLLGLKPAGVLIKNDAFYYDLSKEVLENAKTIEVLNGTSFFTIECPNHTGFGSNGAVPQTVYSSTPLEVTLFISTFVLISLIVTNGVAVSLDKTVLKQNN